MKTKAIGTIATLLLLCGTAWGQATTTTPPPTQPGLPVARPITATEPPQPTQPTQPNGGIRPATEVPSEGLPEAGDDLITFAAFSDPLELSALVDYVARTLDINITIKGVLAGAVVFNAPVSVKRERLLALTASLLEQHGSTLTFDPVSGFYTVVPSGEVPLNALGELPTTRVFSTPNVRPSALKQAIDAQITAGPGGQNRYSPIDELGVIVATDTARRLDAFEQLLNKLLAQYRAAEFTRLELKRVAAPTARERVLQLIGQAAQPRAMQPGEMMVQQQQQMARPGGGLETIGDRLTVDPQGNALIFRGFPEEVEQIAKIIAVIDVANNLTPRPYELGAFAKQFADIARSRGLGEVITISDTSMSNPYMDQFSGFRGGAQPGQQAQQPLVGGPVMVVDEKRGRVIYYGTPEQHEQLATLQEQINVASENVVIEAYRLKHSDSEKVADLILGLIQNRTPGGEGSPLLPGSGPGAQRAMYNPIFAFTGVPGEYGELALGSGQNVFVIADKANNQVLIKAPKREQPLFARLIDRLDLRRPQVYIEVRIVAVTWSDEMRLAFETQLINAGGTGGVLNTNFGLSTFATGAGINQPKTVATGLGGATFALLKNDQVPIVMNALARETDARIVSKPQILVDDNETASINSVDKQPYATTSQSNATTQTGFGGESEAGTKLEVTPQISEGGYLRLKYKAELSSFTGSPTVQGLPPPSQNNIVESNATVPSDFTVVVGGLEFESKTKTRNRVPFIGDIPIIGLLFGDYGNSKRSTTLYIFITPRIMRDPNFADLKLRTQGPQATARLPADLPDLESRMIDAAEPPRRPATGEGGPG